MRRRSAFTLVEMLVALALIIFIMTILSEAFVAGLETFRQLKAIGDMNEKLRTTTTVLRRDLAADHFEGRRRLSEGDFWNAPVREGCFRVWQLKPLTIERNDPTAPVTYSTDFALHFTVKLRGNYRSDFFSAQVPVGSPLFTGSTNFFNQAPDASLMDTLPLYNSQWAEVIYFLLPNETFANGTTPLYTLFRRQRLLVPDNTYANWTNPVVVQNPMELQAALQAYAEISCQKNNPDPNVFPDQLYFNNPTDITAPLRRYGMIPNPAPTTAMGLPNIMAQDAGIPYNPNLRTNTYPQLAVDSPRLAGADVLLIDVVSCEVKIMTATSRYRAQVAPTDAFVDLYDTVAVNQGLAPLQELQSQNPVFTGAGARVFDTWCDIPNGNAGGILYDYSFLAQYERPPPNQPPAPKIPTTRRVPIQPGVLAVQITLRVWDLKTNQTRQVTLVQDM